MATAGRPAWVLFGSQGYFGDDFNEATATASTRAGRSIKASFFPAPPPHPSKLCVHSPGATAEGIEAPRVIAVAGDLILFRVAIETGGLLWVNRPLSLVQCDYFIYRADPNRPMLRRLPRIGRPRTYFQDCEVGILPRGDDDYTIAALIPSNGKFRLLTFRSEAWAWSVSAKLPVGEEKKFPIELPSDESNLAGHRTTNVVIIGGEHGTMGWVDLWRGIVFCDVLREPATLRSIPMPLPMNQIIAGSHFGRGMNSRGIAFVKGGCLKFVELNLDAIDLSVIDEETGLSTLLVSGWSVRTWSNTKMSNSYEDWQAGPLKGQSF
ncbi:uncharacterized protein LOC104584811 [Brachypodium distachyon]|uniref:uncharacterized protein LOC104584811 n=1 Tax=Brachypodium distachyon TaxID=15368 RepID=UPI0001C71444|nr:uncharacterized protein LOC104584811 [Brachypodium distachyon]|eukprot:XP_010238827.1 uncharacterized protein LOC104584811 [Brachypodium distachyon]